MLNREADSSTHAPTNTKMSQVLPRCFCKWRHCREWQKEFAATQHPYYNGVIKLKFYKDDHKSMELKAAVERCLRVDESRRNEWKVQDSREFCRFYVAKHHYTIELLHAHAQDRKNWKWSEPLDAHRAKELLYERSDPYYSGDEESVDSDEARYIQTPNVPKDRVREALAEWHRELAEMDEEQQQADDFHQNAAPVSPVAVSAEPVSSRAKNGESQHTQTTAGTSVTDQVHAMENLSISNAPNADNGGLTTINGTVAPPLVPRSGIPGVADSTETVILREQLSACQQQISQLQNLVQTLTHHVGGAAAPPMQTQPLQPDQPPSAARSRKPKKNRGYSRDESEDDEGSIENSGRLRKRTPSDDDVEDDDGVSEIPKPYNANRSTHSRHGSRHSVRRSSVRSKRSIRRDSVHSRRNSIRSRRSMRGGGDDMSVVSRQSLHSVSPSIKSLPREIELSDDDDEESDSRRRRGGRGRGGRGRDDDYSYNDDSYRRPEDDTRSVGSRSAASRRSKQSFVGSRNRSRNNRPGGGSNSNRGGHSSSSRGSGRGSNGSVPIEIDVSGDELGDETYANASNDTEQVTNKRIVDPYGEQGVYTGELSRSTGMPNGRGRLEYERAGRWYEGDWCHGRWTGFGRLSNGDGDFYEGGLRNDHKHGRGTMRFADGRVFEGEYVRGQMMKGKMTYQDGSVYSGSWAEGMRHGSGRCVFVDGSEYEGEFKEGSFHGQGKMTWNDGGWYIGQWCDGEMHGFGKEIRPDGTLRHEGEWARGQPIRTPQHQDRRRR